MNPIQILGPPRNCRQVKSKEQVIAEIEAWSKIEQSQEKILPAQAQGKSSQPQVSVPPLVPGVVPNLARFTHPYFILPGRFDVGSISKQFDDFVFHDLVLPMGCWKELTLYGNMSTQSLSFDDWASACLNQNPNGMMPADVRYGLMAVCWKYQDDPILKHTVEAIQSEIFRKDFVSCPLNSTSIFYRHDNSALVSHGAGWHIGHPFNCEYEADVAGRDAFINKNSARSDSSIGSTLEKLLGEDDPVRCKTVLEWSSGLKVARLLRDGPNKHTERVLILGRYQQKHHAEIYARYHRLDSGLTRLIRANPQDYIKQ